MVVFDQVFFGLFPNVRNHYMYMFGLSGVWRGKIRKRKGIRFKIESAKLNPCLTLSAILYLTTGNLHDHALRQKLVY